MATVADPVAVSRAWALQLLLDAPDPIPADPPKVHRLVLNQSVLEWARTDPHGLRGRLAFWRITNEEGRKTSDPRRLISLVISHPSAKAAEIRRYLLDRLLMARPEALVEAVHILIKHPQAVMCVMTRYGYTDPTSIGGYLDRDLPRG